MVPHAEEARWLVADNTYLHPASIMRKDPCSSALDNPVTHVILLRMPTYWLTEKKNVPQGDEESWQSRVENLDGVEVLLYQGRRMKVRVDDEIPLRMMVGDSATMDKA